MSTRSSGKNLRKKHSKAKSKNIYIKRNSRCKKQKEKRRRKKESMKGRAIYMNDTNCRKMKNVRKKCNTNSSLTTFNTLFNIWILF